MKYFKVRVPDSLDPHESTSHAHVYLKINWQLQNTAGFMGNMLIHLSFSFSNIACVGLGLLDSFFCLRYETHKIVVDYKPQSEAGWEFINSLHVHGDH